MKKNKNFENTFKEKFENFEAEPSPESWRKIFAAVSVGVTAATGGVASYLSFGKIIAIASIVGSVSIGGYFLLKEKTNLITAENKSASVKDNHIAQAAKETTIPISEKKVSPFSAVNESQGVEIAGRLNREQKSIVAPEIGKAERNAGASAASVSSAKPKNESVIAKEKLISEGKVQPQPQPAKAELKAMPEKREEKPSVYTHIPNKKPEISPDKSRNDELNTNAYLKLAVIVASHANGYAPLAVTFTNAGGAVSNKWNFGDGAVSQENDPFHIFDKAGKYKVTLVSTDYNRTEKDTITVNVKGSSFIAAIPEMFTPNGDGKNDEFKISGHDLVSLKVTVYSKITGKEVYKWNNIEGGWNGRMLNGEMAPAGTYLYIYEAEGADGKKYPFTQGQIKIQR